jgi:TPR repeat protein
MATSNTSKTEGLNDSTENASHTLIRIGREIYIFLAMITILGQALPASAQEHRLALVIGNSEYRSAPTLSTPVRDATAIAAALQRLGFQAILETNLDRLRMKQALERIDLIKRTAEIAIIYYSGYVVQVEGRNWLVPTDASLRRQQDLQEEAVSVEELLQVVRGPRRLRLLILNACSINSFGTRHDNLQGTLYSLINRGVSRIRADSSAGNNAVVYAAAPDHVGDNCVGEHSPFAAALLKHIETPGLEINALLRLVHDDTVAATNGKVEPAVDGSLSGRPVFFRLGPPGTPRGNTTEMEAAIWASIENSNDPADFETFLRQFPDSTFRQSAESKLRLARETKERQHVAALPQGLPVVAAEEAYRKGMEAINRSDFGDAIRYLRAAADGGSAEAMGRIGFLYQAGRGVNRDYNEALQWYQRAADRGSTSAMIAIGSFFVNGWGVPRDYVEAMTWYRKAAERGDAAAMNQIGMLYTSGHGVTHDESEALRWFRKSADLGNATAINNIGVMYRDGTGVPRDYSEALRWFRRGAEGGSGLAMGWLGEMYQDGRGVPRDYAEAMRWYRKAADQGYAVAMNRIGSMYEFGRGVEKNMDQARAWMLRALAAGDTFARGWLRDHPEGSVRK